MLSFYTELKNYPEALLLIAAFWGATVHAIRRKQIPVLEGLLGAVSGFAAGVAFTLIACWKLELPLKEVWFFGFPFAFMSNFFLGGMETVGEQIKEKPIQTTVAIISTWATTVLEYMSALKTPKKP